MSKYAIFYPKWISPTLALGGGGAVGAGIGVLGSHYLWVTILEGAICVLGIIAVIVALIARKRFKRDTLARFAVQSIHPSEVKFL